MPLRGACCVPDSANVMHAKKLDAGFVVADAKYPSVTTVPGELQLTFVDYTDTEVTVQFSDVCAFRWQEGDQAMLEGEPYDGVCEVLGSDWVSEHPPQMISHVGLTVRHIRLNFNACGSLEVLCSSFARHA
jgi:hypothetical protein